MLNTRHNFKNIFIYTPQMVESVDAEYGRLTLLSQLRHIA
jgi:hypothetical protein